MRCPMGGSAPAETWRESGGADACQRANAVWKQLLAEYEQPSLDPAVDEALRDYVARRKRELQSDAGSAR